MSHVRHLIEAYHDGELSARRSAQVKAHLRTCAECRAEAERLERLSDVLAAYTLPDTLTSPEAFRAQVMLRLPRRKTKVRHASWVWHLVPLGLICALVCLEALLVLPDILGGVARLSEWAGIDLCALLGASPSTGIDLGAALCYVLQSQWFGVFRLAWQLAVGFALLLVFVPYVSWMNVLWRSRSSSLA